MLIQVIFEESMEAARSALANLHPEADAIELRLDPVGECDLPGLLHGCRLPAIVTLRTPASGGAFGMDRERRESLLAASFEAGADYVDLEFDTDDRQWIPRKEDSRVILSAHFPERMPDDLEELYSRMAEVPGVDVLKIVPFADSLTDNLRIRDLLARARREGRALAAFCMGPKGLVSRILALAWGSWAVFGAARRGRESAPGQPTLTDLSERYRVQDLDDRTRLLGVLGHPLGHSLSPVVHNRALREQGDDSCYLPFETELLGEFLPFLKELNIGGFSVTLPHKETILPHLDELDPVAARLGAVNTVVKKWNRFVGHNTDVPAALRVLERIMLLEGRKVCLLGTGGAGRALAGGLRDAGARLVILNRTVERARELAAELDCEFGSLEDCGREECDILINATPIGMHPATGEMPVPPEAIRARVAFDLIYNPPETRFLQEAGRRGCRTIGGLEMFLEQARDQFRMFTGREAPVEAMRQAAEEALALTGKKGNRET